MKKLAKIKSASLQIEDHGILTFFVQVDYEDGGSQGVGGYALDRWDSERKERVGTAYGCEMIRRLLDALGVNDFSQMAGLHVWVYGEGDGLKHKVTGIGALSVNSSRKPLMFDELAEYML